MPAAVSPARLGGVIGRLTGWVGRGQDATDRDEPHYISVERTLVAARWLAVVIVALGIPFAGLRPEDLIAAYGVLAWGAVYILTIQAYVIRRHPHWLAGGYVTSVGEAVLTSLLLFATGGAASPLFATYFLSVVAAAVRFGVRSMLFSVGVCLGTYLIVVAVHPSGLNSPGELVLRFGIVFLVGLLASFLAREAEESRRALAAELNRTRDLHRDAAALADENARLSVDLQRQLRELERAQHQLIQSTKLAAIGELAANVAHEINNPLTAVLINTELVADNFPSDHPHRQDLLTVRDEALRARGIVRHLLNFARQRPPTVERADPRAILDETIPLVQKVATLARVEIVRNYAGGPIAINADVNQMKQVFLNLLTNAIDVMPDGGHIYISVERCDGQVLISLRDTGPGISPHYRDRIFEPFFTTKSAISGTGLGLSVSYGIIEGHHGTITAGNEPGGGALFTVSLPLAEGSVEPGSGS